MTQKTISLHFLRKIGFKVENQNDEVFEKEYGIPFLLARRKLTDYFQYDKRIDNLVKIRIELDWDCLTKTLSMVRYNTEEGDVYGRMPIYTYPEAKAWIDFFNNIPKFNSKMI